MRNNRKTAPKGLTGIVETQVAAARALKVTVKTIRAWKAEGGEEAGFLPDGRIDLGKLVEWLEKRRSENHGSTDLKDEKTLEEIRKLKLANDLKEGRLIERQWMVDRMHAVAGRINQSRLKSESEHPLLFAAASGDVSACREVVKKIWSEIFIAIQNCATEFEKGQNG